MIQKLRDYAELAQASYGYFHYASPNFKPNTNKDEKKLSYFRDIYHKNNPSDKQWSKAFPTPADILNIEYKYYKDENGKIKNSWYDDKFLKGDFTPTQAKRFFERYTLIGHIPDDKNLHIPYDKRGFSATIFYDKLNANYIIAFRGTNDYKDVFADMQLAISGIAISQVVNLQNLIVNMLGHIYVHHSSQSNIDSHSFKSNNNTSTDSSNASKQNLTILKEYFLQHNIQIILTGHSLGGHLAQVFCLTYPLVVKEIYTYNSPGLGNIIDFVLVKFLRVIGIIWKLLCKLAKGIAKLFNPNGFTRKTIDANLAKSGCKENTDDIIRVMEVNKDKEIFGELGINAKKARRGENLGVEIHHIESVIVDMCDDCFLYSVPQLFETIFCSTITSLGMRLGLNINDKLDYKNTEALHLINLGYPNHAILPLTQYLYFYAYLLELDFNVNRYANANIANTIDNLNGFIQWIENSLRTPNDTEKERNIRRNTFQRSNTTLTDEKYSLDYLLSEISHIAHNKYDKGIQKFDKDKQIDTIIQLQQSKIYTKILDRDYFDNLANKQCNITDIRAFIKCQPFIVVDKNNQEILQEDNMTELFLYKDFTNIATQIRNSYQQSEII
ncbi:lipase family protein [Helicobacter sp. T3_23-1056]